MEIQIQIQTQMQWTIQIQSVQKIWSLPQRMNAKKASIRRSSLWNYCRTASPPQIIFIHLWDLWDIQKIQIQMQHSFSSTHPVHPTFSWFVEITCTELWHGRRLFPFYTKYVFAMCQFITSFWLGDLQALNISRWWSPIRALLNTLQSYISY